MSLTVFYDGSCPICVKEMNQLKHWDVNSQLHLVDVLNEQIKEKYPHIDPVEAMRILHAETDDGKLLLGLDANVAAWQQVNRKSWLAILRWPLIKPLADMAYLFFARNRYTISRIFTGESCNKCRIK
ncbi:MAG: thiol-disulfide oxidoreductase DCC family protein [Porticoccaceae bacterium]